MSSGVMAAPGCLTHDSTVVLQPNTPGTCVHMRHERAPVWLQHVPTYHMSSAYYRVVISRGSAVLRAEGPSQQCQQGKAFSMVPLRCHQASGLASNRAVWWVALAPCCVPSRAGPPPRVPSTLGSLWGPLPSWG